MTAPRSGGGTSGQHGGPAVSGPLNVVVATDENCLLGCAVAVRSLLENTRAEHVRVFAVHSGIEPGDLGRLKASWQSAVERVTVELHPFAEARVADLLRSKAVSRMAYARLFIGELLPGDAGRCLYVDSDVLFELDAVDLYRTDLRRKTVGAVLNDRGYGSEEAFRRLGVSGDGYFASGLLLIDLDRWRRREVGRRALEFARAAGDSLIMHDQDALNAVLVDDWHPLPERWNNWASWGEPEGGAVLHFPGVPKPWDPDYDGPFRDRFFSYLDRTEFAGWRPPHLLGLAPLAAKLRRKVPYPPAVARMTRQAVQEAIGRLFARS